MRARVVRAHRLALQLNAVELQRIEELARARQKAYNWALAMLRDIWGLDRCADRWRALDQIGQPYRGVDKFTLIRLFIAVKPSLDWTIGVPTRVFEYAFEDLMAAVRAYLDNRGTSRRVGFPGFVPAREADTFTLRDHIGLVPGQDGHRDAIKLPGLSPLRVCGSTRHLERELARYDGQIREATVSRSGERRSVSVLIERDAKADLVDPAILGPQDSVGMDLGLTTYATFSDGRTLANPRFGARMARSERHSALGVGRKQSRRDLEFNRTGVMPPKSHRQLDSEADLARTRRRTRCRRVTFAAQSAATVFPRYRVLGREDLAVANMVQNHHLARSIADAGWSSFTRALDSRAVDQGCLVVKADRFFASSQICSSCGFQNKDLKDLSIRAWTCPVCRAVNQRDPNAATNLRPTSIQIVAAHACAVEVISKYERGKRRRAERAAAAALTNRQHTTERTARAAHRTVARAQAKTDTRSPSIQPDPHRPPGHNLSCRQVPGYREPPSTRYLGRRKTARGEPARLGLPARLVTWQDHSWQKKRVLPLGRAGLIGQTLRRPTLLSISSRSRP